MQGHAGRVRLPTSSASPKWSAWPWLTSSRSQRSTSVAGRGLRGFPNHGSNRIVLPPGVVTCQQACPYQVNVAFAFSPIGVAPPRVTVHASGGTSRVLGYTRSVPAERIAENLAFINWTVLTGLAFGSFAAVVLARMRTDATRGFLAFTAVCAVVFAILAYVSDQALPNAVAGTSVQTDPAFDTPRRVALAGFGLLAAAYAIALVRRRRAPLLAAAGLIAASATLVFGALGWAGTWSLAVPL